MHLEAWSTNRLALPMERAVPPREEQGATDLTAAELPVHPEAWSVKARLANCAAAPFEEQGIADPTFAALMERLEVWSIFNTPSLASFAVARSGSRASPASPPPSC